MNLRVYPRIGIGLFFKRRSSRQNGELMTPRLLGRLSTRKFFRGEVEGWLKRAAPTYSYRRSLPN
jgi:hypothetical protein